MVMQVASHGLTSSDDVEDDDDNIADVDVDVDGCSSEGSVFVNGEVKSGDVDVLNDDDVDNVDDIDVPKGDDSGNGDDANANGIIVTTFCSSMQSLSLKSAGP